MKFCKKLLYLLFLLAPLKAQGSMGGEKYFIKKNKDETTTYSIRFFDNNDLGHIIGVTLHNNGQEKSNFHEVFCPTNLIILGHINLIAPHKMKVLVFIQKEIMKKKRKGSKKKNEKQKVNRFCKSIK